ncbi:MAG: hypothetical protein IJ894_10115 [Bacteroidales bacterium]|nr:hypothetical protein [Bacteroidales bacterium]MBR2201082.1 hypothetical protein [Bacteroidales bacterium]MBR4272347.1 hypothetical protein [Bacteroidales bacterium]
MYKLKFYIPLIIAVAMLLAVSLPMVGLPYCYSETRLLGDSIFYMKNHGIGLVFNGESVELPDFFSLIYSLLAMITTNQVALHLCALIFPAATIYVAFQFGKFFFSIQGGVIAAAIMTVQNVFIAQSGLVLPTMMLNACILGGIYLYFREKYKSCTALMCVAAITDITGLVAATLLLISYFRIKYKEWRMNDNLLMALPIALWFVYQAISLGICGKFSMRHCDFSFANFAHNAWFIFIAQHRWAMTAVLLAVLAVNTVNKNMLYFVKEMAWKGAAMFGLLYLTNSILSADEGYCLVPISLMAVYTGCAISTLHTSYYSKYIVACAVMAAAALGVTDRSSVTDAYVNYKSKVKVDMKTVELVSSSAKSYEPILCDKYFSKYISNSDYGYISRSSLLQCSTPDDAMQPQWLIYTNFVADAHILLLREYETYEKKHTIYIGDCLNEIYCKTAVK